MAVQPPRRRRLSAGLSMLLVLAGLPLATALPELTGHGTAARAAAPTVIVNQPFSQAAVTDSAWKPGGAACLTGRPTTGGTGVIPSCAASQTGPVPPIGTTPGYLQFTDTKTNQAGSVLYDRPIPATAGLQATFEQYQYGGSDADGISFFLVDGATALATTGANGGSLGYAQKDGNQSGVHGGYLGLGLDVYGNFYDDGETRGKDCPVGQRSPTTASGRIAPNVVTLRGPGEGLSGYCFLQASVVAGPTVDRPISTLPASLTGATLDTVKRTVRVQVTPEDSNGHSQVIVDIDFGSGYQRVLDTPAPANEPSTYKFGFAGSTGASTDVHLIRNVVVQSINPLDSLELVKQVDRTGNALPAQITAGTTVPYQFVVTNAGAESLTGLTIVDPKVTDIVCPAGPLPPEPAPGGTVVCTGRHLVTAAEAAGASITNTAHATATAPGPTTVTSDDSSVTVPLHAQLTLTKTAVTPGPYAIGEQVNYSYLLRNTGGATVASIGVTDNRVAVGGVKCDLTSLDPGASTPCTGATVLTRAMLAADGSLTNTATARGTTPVGQQVTSPPAAATIAVAADIGVAKTISDPAPTLGAPLQFTVTAHNYGPSAASNVVVSDPVPLGLTGATASVSAGAYDIATGRWTIPAMAVGDSPTLTLNATVSSVAVLNNGARVISLDQPDLNPANDAASVVGNPVEPTADIAIVKSASAPTVVLGKQVTFTVTASNSGPYAATGLLVRDTLPTDLSFVSAGGDGSFDPAGGVWTIGDLPVGQHRTLTLVAVATGIGTAANVAAVAASGPRDPNQGNNVDTAHVDVVPPTANLGVTKVVDVPSVPVGGQATYTITARNNGPDDSPSAQAVETIPRSAFTIVSANASVGTYDQTSGLWTIGKFPAGTNATLTITVQAKAPGSYNNTVVINDPQAFDPDPSLNSASAVIAVDVPQVVVDVGVTTTVDDARVPVGGTTTLHVRVHNLPTLVPSGTAGSPVTGLVLRNQLPPGLELAGPVTASGTTTFDPATGAWTVGDLAVDGTATLDLPVRVTAAQTLIDNAAIASLGQVDVNDTNNDSSASVNGFLSADLGITKTVTPNPATVGGNVTYTVTVTNHGPTLAEAIEAVDPVPLIDKVVASTVSEGTFDPTTRVWSVGRLEAGESATLTLVEPVTDFGTFVNTAVLLGSHSPDPDPANDLATATVAGPGADIAVSKTADNLRPTVGSVLTYTVTARNLGPDGAPGVVITDPVPAGATVVASTASQGSYDAATGLWTVGDLALLGEAHLSVQVRPQQVGLLVNTAGVAAGASRPDPDPTNNQQTVSVDVQPEPYDLTAGKSVSQDLVPLGQQFSFQLLTSNLGPGGAHRLTLRDPVPDGLRPDAAPGCVIAGQLVTCAVDSLAAKASAAFTVTATAVEKGSFTNTVSVVSATGDPVGPNNAASSTVQVAAKQQNLPPLPQPAPTPTAAPDVGPEPAPVPADTLPNTGANSGALLLLSVCLIGAGAALTRLRRH